MAYLESLGLMLIAFFVLHVKGTKSDETMGQYISKSSFGIGMVSAITHHFHPPVKIQGAGGLKEASIQTECGIQEVENFVQNQFHSTVEAALHANVMTAHQGEDQSESDEAVQVEIWKTCHSEFGGLCQNIPHRSLICKLVKVFSRCDLKAGRLFFMTTSSGSFLGFLGVCLQRPHLQTFVKVELDATVDQVSIATASDGHPIILTSHQVFQQLVTDPREVISVQVWEYEVFQRGAGIMIQVSDPLLESGTPQYTLDPAAKVEAKRPKRRLMFGLKIRSRKKKSKKNVSMSKKVKKKRKNRGTHRENAIDKDDAKTNSSSSSSESGVDDNGLQLPESELYQPMSSEAAAEEAEATEIVLEHEAFVADNLPSSSGTRKNANGNGPGPGKSFFSKVKGIDSVAIAVSARFKCYFCDNRIDKGTVRFCFYHNELRPSVWVHPSCIPHLLKREGLLAHGVVQLESLQSEGQATSIVLKTVREVLVKVRTFSA